MELTRRNLLVLVGAGSLAATQMTALSSARAEGTRCTSLEIPNAGFEDPVTRDGIPEWTQRRGSGGFSVGTDQVAEGAQALHVENATGVISLVSPRVPVTPGKYYAATVQAMWFSGRVQIYVYFYDGNGREISARNRIFDGLAAGEWYWLGMGDHAPADAAEMEVMIYSPRDNADFWIDDLQIVETHSRVTPHGNAAEVLSLVGMTVVGTRAYVVTRNQIPAVLGEYDIASGTLTGRWELPDSQGAWALTHDERYVYIVGYTGARLHVLDTQTGDLRSLPGFGIDSTMSYGVDMGPDGMLYVATYPDASVRRIDPETGAAEVFARVSTTATYARSISVQGSTMVVGTAGGVNGLYRIDIDSAEVTHLPVSISTPGLGWVTVSLAGDVFYAADRHVVVKMDLDGELLGSWELPGSQIDTLRALPDGSVWTASRPDGAIHRLAPGAEDFEYLGAPADGQEHREISVLPDGAVAGLAGDGSLWIWCDGEFSIEKLWETDLNGPTLLQDMCLLPDGKVVASASGIVIHDPRSTADPAFIPIAATPIRVAHAHGDLYTATYPRTEIIRIDLETLETTTLAVIGQGQSRPWSMHYSESHDSLVIATAGSGDGRGAVTRFDLGDESLVTWDGVLGDRAVTTAVTVGDRTFIAGGLGDGIDAALAEIDLESGEVLWLVEPVPGRRTIESIAQLDGIIYGSVRGGYWFAFDIESRETLRIGWLYANLSYGNVQVHEGRVILPVHRGMVFELDLDHPDSLLLLDGLDEGWRRGPKVLFREDGLAWGMDGVELAEFDLDPCHLPAPEEPTVEAVRTSTDAYIVDGAVAGPLAAQLTNALDQAERYQEAGRVQPALNAIDRFIRHLENPKQVDTLTEGAAEDLLGKATALRDHID